MDAEVIIRIRHPIMNPDATVIETNTCRAVVRQVLTNFITSQCGKYADRHKPTVRHEYRIVLMHSPGTNRFSVTGDTEHNALTAGIIMRIMEHWDHIPIKPLLQ